jgi:hypothetical protein
MPRRKLFLLGFLAVTLFAVSLNATQHKTPPGRLAAFRDNQCVICHARLTEPLRVSAHFFEWLNSPHERKNVGCEKCHGGDSSISTFRTAHQGVARASFPTSRLAPKNAPETCRNCHLEAVQVFTQSRHFQQLLTTGDGPSCTTCHHHMATSVIYRPPDTAALCANCHGARGPAAAYSKVPEQAGDTIAALTRADEVLDWSRFLITQGKKRRLNFAKEEAEIIRFEQTLKAAKLDWHSFDLSVARAKADQVFLQATALKDQLTDRLSK